MLSMNLRFVLALAEITKSRFHNQAKRTSPGNPLGTLIREKGIGYKRYMTNISEREELKQGT